MAKVLRIGNKISGQTRAPTIVIAFSSIARNISSGPHFADLLLMPCAIVVAETVALWAFQSNARDDGFVSVAADQEIKKLPVGELSRPMIGTQPTAAVAGPGPERPLRPDDLPVGRRVE
jgi:hypothetical protein